MARLLNNPFLLVIGLALVVAVLPLFLPSTFYVRVVALVFINALGRRCQKIRHFARSRGKGEQLIEGPPGYRINAVGGNKIPWKRRTGKPARAARVHRGGSRIIDGSGSGEISVSLGDGGNTEAASDSLADARPFIAEEEEGRILLYRSSDGRAELVLFEFRQG